jgi:hypothetical protein
MNESITFVDFCVKYHDLNHYDQKSLLKNLNEQANNWVEEWYTNPSLPLSVHLHEYLGFSWVENPNCLLEILLSKAP